MNDLAEKYAGRGVGSIFLYTHEAHPGEFYPHLTSMAQKFAHARDLRDKLGVTRPILVDALDGACHRAYGSMPNMTWLFTRTGVPVYKADWTDAGHVEEAIRYALDIQEQRRGGRRLAPYLAERVEYREIDRPAFMRGLERNGPKAVTEFETAFD